MLDKLNALYEMSASRIRHEFEGKVVILKNLGGFSPIYTATIGNCLWLGDRQVTA